MTDLSGGTVDVSNIPVDETTNYLVPSSGGTHAVQISGVATSTPAWIDWNAFSQSDFPFQPQGVFIDNTQGSDDVEINICSSINGPPIWTLNCPAGVQTQSQFPAPNGQVHSVTGDGQVNLIYVDFPVLPNAGAVAVTGGEVGISGQPIQTLPAVNNGGAPYQTQLIPPLASAPQYGAISGTATSLTLTPAVAQQYLRKLLLSLSGNASLPTAELEVITVTANSVQILKRSVYIPAAALDSSDLWALDLDLNDAGIAMGAGDLVITLGTALTTGTFEANAFFA